MRKLDQEPGDKKIFTLPRFLRRREKPLGQEEISDIQNNFVKETQRECYALRYIEPEYVDVFSRYEKIPPFFIAQAMRHYQGLGDNESNKAKMDQKLTEIAQRLQDDPQFRQELESNDWGFDPRNPQAPNKYLGN